MASGEEKTAAARRPRRRWLAPLPALCLLATFAPSAHAQEEERSSTSLRPPILKLTTSARALALGGAFWTGSGGTHAIFHHPALISGQGFDIAVAGHGLRRGHNGDDDDHSERERDRDDGRHRGKDGLHTALSASAPWFGGSVGVGVAVFDHGAALDFDVPEERDRTSAPSDRPVTVLQARPAGTEFVAAVGYRREFLGFGVGAAAKVVGQTVGGVRDRTGALDLGVSRGMGRVTAALAVQNLGPDLELRGRPVSLPTRVVLGAGTTGRTAVGPLDIGGAVQVAHERSGEIVPGGGVEIAYWPIQRRVFIVRLGAVRVVEGDGSPVTFGAGFEGDRIRVDYAYSDRDPVAGPHRIGVSIR